MSRIRLSKLAALLRTAPAALQTTARIEILGAIAAPAVLRAPMPAFTVPHRPLTTTTFAASADFSGVTSLPDQMEVIASLIGTSQKLMAEGKLTEAGDLLAQGAKQAEAALGPALSVLAAPLWNQLALIRFLDGRCDDAAAASAKACAAVRELTAEDRSPQAQGAAAAATVRFATTLVGAGRAEEAAPLLIAARSDLDAAIADMAAILSKIEDTGDKNAAAEARHGLMTFQAASGEALFYSNLCALAALLENATPADVEQYTAGMVAGLSAMTASLGTLFPVTAAALREHNCLIQRAMEAGQGPLVEALMVQAVSLFEVHDPQGSETAGMWHNLGTLQSGLGRYESAVQSLRHALEMMAKHPVSNGEALIAKQALVVALGAAGRHDEAREVVVAVAPELIQTLGEGNPLSLELELAMTKMRVQEVRDEVAAGRMDAAEASMEEERLLGEIARLGQALEPYVEEYRNKAQQTFEEIKRGGGGGGGDKGQ